MSSIGDRNLASLHTDKEIDPEGEATLEVLSAAPHFNRWMYETIRPFLQEPVLEIGSGIGNISRFLLDEGLRTHLSDLRPNYCRKLQENFGARPNCAGISRVNLVDPDFDRVQQPLLNRFGTVFALNVVEHIADHTNAIANCTKLLRPGGQLIILVPAFQFLFNRFDRELGHFRRYNRGKLTRLFQNSGLDVLDSFYFNAAGMLGWFYSGSILRNRILPSGQVNLFNRLVGLFRVLDRWTGRRLGLSVVAVGRSRRAAELPLAA